MPARHAKPLDINLIPRDPLTNSMLGKVLTWSLSTGRYIVVFTEMIVILTFLSRFTLDRQLNDLNGILANQEQLLISQSGLESEVRAIQSKGSVIESLLQKPNLPETLRYLFEIAPSDIAFDRIDVRPDRISVSGLSFSQVALEGFVSTLKQNPIYSDVILDRVATSEDVVGIEFTVRANAPASPAPKPQTTQEDSDAF